ncbi:MAG: sulfite exporter TauE/SafE family protein [Nitrospirae bacterium]|nr:MAG: sulfite exporter TauE/SafE family protein [Nitrospirota bacterium]
MLSFLDLLLFLIGASVGFLSGLLGIGGGIVMFPLLLYLPPLFGFSALDIKSITGLTMVQGFFASLTALFFHHKQRFVNKPLVVCLGLSLFASSFAGALYSKTLPDRALLIIFCMLSIIAAIMMFLPRSAEKDDSKEDSVTFNKALSVIIGLCIGFLTGMVGQGGAFLLIPTILYILKIPLRVALGSTLGIGLFSATAGLAGKVITDQVPLIQAIPMLLGAIPAASLGSFVSKNTESRHLRWLLALLITATALRILADVF